jgi:hypothetical protein
MNLENFEKFTDFKHARQKRQCVSPMIQLLYHLELSYTYLKLSFAYFLLNLFLKNMGIHYCYFLTESSLMWYFTLFQLVDQVANEFYIILI